MPPSNTNLRIHIGAAKAASSLIQWLLRQSERQVFGPKCRKGKNIKNWVINHSGHKPDITNGIVTHEGLSVQESISGESISARLQSLSRNLNILYIMREQKDWLRSRYNQDYKRYMGKDTDFYSFNDWIDGWFHEELSRKFGSHIHLYKPRKRIRHDKIMEQYLDKPHVEIKVLYFEDLRHCPQQFVSSVCSWADISEVMSIPKKNSSINDTALFLHKLLTKIIGANNVFTKNIPHLVPDIYEFDYSVPEKIKNDITVANSRLCNKGFELPDDYIR